MLSTGFVGAEHANIPIGGSVAVFAQRPAGLMAPVGARLRGAGLVIGVESMAIRQAVARKYGCDAIVDYTKEDPVEAIMHLTSGKGLDSSIEAQVTARPLAASVSVTRPGGTISNIGYHGDGDTVPIPSARMGRRNERHDHPHGALSSTGRAHGPPLRWRASMPRSRRKRGRSPSTRAVPGR